MPEDHVLLRNRRPQPVELHLPGGTVLVLPPHGEQVVPGDCLGTPQVAWLLARKALDTRPLPAPEPGSEAPAEAAGPAPPRRARAPQVPKAAAEAAAPPRGLRRSNRT